jgi:hypothetical protein
MPSKNSNESSPTKQGKSKVTNPIEETTAQLASLMDPAKDRPVEHKFWNTQPVLQTRGTALTCSYFNGAIPPSFLKFI